jgi:hypothetical protein
MSQRVKRLTKKIKRLSENFVRENEINNVIDNIKNSINDLSKLTPEEDVNIAIKYFEEIINQGNNELDNLWKEYGEIIAYIYKENDAHIGYDVIKLLDDTELDITILEMEDIVLVASQGFVGKAKKHEQDEFDFEIGYQIAVHRLIEKILNKKYGYGGE